MNIEAIFDRFAMKWYADITDNDGTVLYTTGIYQTRAEAIDAARRWIASQRQEQH